MSDLIAMAPAFLFGWILVRLLAPLPLSVEIPLGAGIGAAIFSAIYFVLTCAATASRSVILSVEIIALVTGAALAWRFRRARATAPNIASPKWIWALRIAAALALIIAGMDFFQSITANPDGGYDAAAIWKIRARYLAGGSATWRYAITETSGVSHPGYPLLLSGFIARTWTLIGDLRSSTPAALSGVFTLATLALLFGSVAMLAGEALGWLALLVLCATEGFMSQAAVQYADIPLAFFILGSVALLAIAAQRNWSALIVALAGFSAGAAAWTKNEGLAFVLIVLILALWRGGFRTALFAAAGAAPMLVVTIALKLMAQGRDSVFPETVGQALRMLADGSRWPEILSSFSRNFWQLGPPWAHPFLLIAVLAWAFGFIPHVRSRLWLLAAPAALLAADIAVYLVTMSGLTWQLDTSNNRVIAQVWPALLFGFFLLLKPIEAAKPSHAKRR